MPELGEGEATGDSLEQQSVGELLAGYATTLAELRRRGVVRSGNAPAGDYAEWLVAKALGGTLADNFSVKSWDVLLPDGTRVQVKARLVSPRPGPGQLQTSPFRSWDFEHAALVLLRAADYGVHRAALAPMSVVQEAGRWRSHVNGYVVTMSAGLLDHANSKDITELLRSAAGE